MNKKSYIYILNLFIFLNSFSPAFAQTQRMIFDFYVDGDLAAEEEQKSPFAGGGAMMVYAIDRQFLGADPLIEMETIYDDIGGHTDLELRGAIERPFARYWKWYLSQSAIWHSLGRDNQTIAALDFIVSRELPDDWALGLELRQPYWDFSPLEVQFNLIKNLPKDIRGEIKLSQSLAQGFGDDVMIKARIGMQL